MQKESIARLEKKSLKRVLGVRDLFAIGYGDLGSSIYYALGATALFALGATPIALALAGFVFICTALTYAELSSTFPEPGGSATFTRYAFNDLVSFIAGWGLMLDYIVTLAISAFAIPPYLSNLFTLVGFSRLNSVPQHLTWTICVLIALFIVNLIGVKQSGRLSYIFALLTGLTQGVVILFGILFLSNISHVIEMMKIGVANMDLSPTWGEFLKGVAMAMVAYTGIEAITQLAGETKKPSSAIPKAIKITIGVLFFMYIGISIVALSVISPQELGTTYINDPIAGIVMSFPIGGQFIAPWIGIAAAIILLIASNAGLIGCSRLAFSMGEYYQLPAICYKTHERFRTPYVSLAIFTLLGILVVLLSRGKMLFLADLYNIGAQLAFFSANIALIVLRIKRPELERPYRAPLNIPLGNKKSIPLTAVVGALCNLAVFILVLVTKPEGRIAAIIWMALGLLMYFYYRRQKKLSATGQLQVHKIHIPDYAPMSIKNILVTARAKGNTESLQTAFQLAHLHHAKVTAAHIIEIPPSLPMDIQMTKREEIGERALLRAQAVASEYHVTVDLSLVRARSIETALLELIKSHSIDLIVLGVDSDEFHRDIPFVREAKKLFEDAPCRVLVLRD